MNCPYQSDLAFGPRVDAHCRSLDFTLAFEDIFFGCLSAAIFLSLWPFYIALLLRKPVTRPVRSRLLACRMAALTGALATQLIFLIFRVQQRIWQTRASLAADVLGLISFGAALVLSFVDFHRSLRPSTPLALYLSALAILGVARIRTLWLIGYGRSLPAVGTACFTFVLTALLLESVDNQPLARQGPRVAAPEQYSGFWNRTFFAWLASTLQTGYAKIISLDDLPPLDTQLQSHHLREKLMSSWNKDTRHKRHSLLRACFRAYLSSLLSAVIPRLCLTALEFTQPFLVNTTVSFIGLTDPNKNYGKGLIGSWALVFAGMAVANSIYKYQSTRFVTRLRGGLVALIYRRTLEIRDVDHGDITAIALMGTDVDRVVNSLQMLHEVWASLLDVSIAVWLLERQLSLACLAPVVLIVVFMGATMKLSLTANKLQRRWIEKVQERLRATNSILDNIKAVKMLGLMGVMSDAVQNLRLDEIRTSAAFRKLLIVMLLLSNTPINLAPLVTFVVYTIIAVFWKNESLFTARAFTSVTLISLLTTPVIVFIQTLPRVIQCLGSFDRIQEYCNYYVEPLSEDNDDAEWAIATQGSIARMSELSRTSLPIRPITFNGDSFTRGKSSRPILKDLNVQIQVGSITAIVGPVGSGKSTFLESILGETVTTTSKRTSLRGQFSYCSQQPWLEHTTILQNIIGVAPLEPEWYKTVIASCGLEPDIRQLEKADHTVVGSNGLNLSGGQKQRIALARALYSRKPVAVLDNVFSSMDTSTAKSVSRCLLGHGGLFRQQRATVILTSYSRDVLSFADSIIALEDGRVINVSSPESLLGREDYVTRLDLEPFCTDISEASAPKREPDREDSRVLSNIAGEDEEQNTDIGRKNGQFSVYAYYLASAGYITASLYTGFMVLWIFCNGFSTVWLKWWSEANDIHPNSHIGMYISIYAMLGILGTLGACGTAWFAFISIISNTALRMHFDLLKTTMGAPFSYFAMTDTGELTNRFSQDMELIDMALPTNMVNYTSTAMSCIVQVIILLVFSNYLGAAVPVFGTLLYFLQRFYLQTSRQLRLLEIEVKAPLYTHFNESVTGVTTIRAFGWQSEYQERNFRFIDSSQRPAYLLRCIQHWLAFMLDTIVGALCVTLVSIVLTWRSKFSAGSVGVSLVMVVGFNEVLARVIVSWTNMESSIGAVARVRRFVAETELENDGFRSVESLGQWPKSGSLEFANVVASYRHDMEPVLKGISLSMQPGEHIAICGRSGSGKTSLVLCLLRMMDVQSGHITFDGVDISTLGCNHVRSCISVMPQEPFLMSGTMRFNIDPFGAATDEDITAALTKVRLWDTVETRGGLDAEIEVTAWSAGQKQLLCLARAMVKKSKLLVLDEAASSVDSETEAAMQEIVDTEFHGCTVVSVMHRLEYIDRYDRVIVMDRGEVLRDERSTVQYVRDLVR